MSTPHDPPVCFPVFAAELAELAPVLQSFTAWFPLPDEEAPAHSSAARWSVARSERPPEDPAVWFRSRRRTYGAIPLYPEWFWAELPFFTAPRPPVGLLVVAAEQGADVAVVAQMRLLEVENVVVYLTGSYRLSDEPGLVDLAEWEVRHTLNVLGFPGDEVHVARDADAAVAALDQLHVPEADPATEPFLMRVLRCHTHSDSVWLGHEPSVPPGSLRVQGQVVRGVWQPGEPLALLGQARGQGWILEEVVGEEPLVAGQVGWLSCRPAPEPWAGGYHALVRAGSVQAHATCEAVLCPASAEERPRLLRCSSALHGCRMTLFDMPGWCTLHPLPGEDRPFLRARVQRPVPVALEPGALFSVLSTVRNQMPVAYGKVTKVFD